MNKTQITGIILLITGCAAYFFVSSEPYTTILGFIAGIGFGILLWGFTSKAKRY